MKKYDLAFVGHMCYDVITPFGGEEKTAPGSAVLCGAMVAARIGKSVAAVVKMSADDESILQPMKDVGIDTFVIPAEETTVSHVFHPVADVDVRELKIAKTAAIIADWGCSEVVITQSAGVLARHDGKSYYEKFTNKTMIGRTGRGDTTFAAYLSHRMDHDAKESLKFAAALCSIKMEHIDPFAGTLEDVNQRIAERY